MITDKARRAKIHVYSHIFGIAMIATGLSLGKIFMSLGMFVILLNSLLEGQFNEKWERIRSNKPLLWLLLFYGLHLSGLLWTSDFAYGLHDVKTKLTLIVIPLVIIAKPISKEHQRLIFIILALAAFLATVINFINYQHWIGHHIYSNIRDMSLFGSHIRFSIILIFSSILVIMRWKSYSATAKKLWLVVLLWMAFYTFYSQVLTSYIALFVVFTTLAVIKQNSKNKYLFALFVGSMVVGIGLLIQFIVPNEPANYDLAKLPKYTQEGNLYRNDFSLIGTNGNIPVGISICDLELEREWEKRSARKYYGRDDMKQLQRTTLIRFLCSKNLKRDASGVKALSKSEIQAIEKGIADVHETRVGLIARLYGIKYQFENSGDPNGHSLLQRFEFWKTAKQIIAENWFIGVGTGDVQQSFDKKYEANKSLLRTENRLRAHNSYLTYWLTFGIGGILVFIVVLYQFLRHQIQEKNLEGILFAVILIVTFAFEDTLETQLGVTLFAFFFGIYCGRSKKNEPVTV